ncbi:Fibronectin type III domain-containing protein 7 [Chelonia mydas]|uniref:Fibronectin type III domain-containing protein 7 n=1 Tax=Chelonia mydas TaxID=8469 RepID=M7BSC7_CHEMY|nr:Fibronectin type III domain-containing protein 7 [Chelonia mydas]
MCSGKGKSSVLIGFILISLEMIVSANTGFSISIYNVTSRNIYLRWSKFSGAFSYRITATPMNTVGHPLLAHFNDVPVIGILTSLTPNTVHTVKVEAIDKNGIILAEAQTMQLTAPEIPAIDQAYSKLSNSITVEWAAVPGATSYLLTAQDGESFIETIVINSPGTVTGLKAATLYKITIRSINSGGRSLPSPSKKAKTVLAAPVLSVSSPSYDSIVVSWGAVYMAVGFSVSIMRSDGLGSMMKENTTHTSLVFTSLDPGTLYTIKAHAWNVNGIPGDDFTYNQITIPCAPGSITIEEDNPGKLSVSWSNVDLGDYYVVFVKSDDGLEVHCNTSHTQCHFQSDCGFTYFISVFAYNKAGQSPLGDVLNYTTAPCCPSDFYPVFVSSDTVEIVWSPVRGAEMYETKAVDGVGVVLCNDTATICILSALQCNTQYNITVYSYSEIRGSNTSCVSKYVATGACCPSGVKLYRLRNNGIRIYWRASAGLIKYSTDLYGSKGNFTCTPTSGFSYCDVTEIPCGDVYTVVVSPVPEKGSKLTFCPKKIYSGFTREGYDTA